MRDFIWRNPDEIPGNRLDDDGNGYVDDVSGWDVSDLDNDANPPATRDDFYHGTHVAGIITRILRQTYGDGIEELVKLVPVKTIADNAETDYLMEAFLGFDYANAIGADLIVTAWGMNVIGRFERGELQESIGRGALVVAASGNLAGEREQFPAAMPEVLAVGALNRDGQKRELSSFGQFVDLSAPGEGIVSAGIDSDQATAARDGSSYAAAIVAGAAAVVQLQHPHYPASKVSACLQNTARPLVSETRLTFARLGAGRLNMERAVSCLFAERRSPESNLLTLTRGYLHSNHNEVAQYWTLRPAGEFSGIRFRRQYDVAMPMSGRIEFRSAGNDPQSAAVKVVASHELAAMPAEVFIPGKEVFVDLYPNQSGQSDEMLIAYEVETIDLSSRYCRGVEALTMEGALSDGSGGEPYSPNSDCKWLITAPEGKRVRFHFERLDTEANTDSLYFFAGEATNAPIIANYSGSDLPAEFRQLDSWGRQVLLWFVSNGNNEGDGWQLRYEFVDAPVDAPIDVSIEESNAAQ